jgi:hypothetical protein
VGGGQGRRRCAAQGGEGQADAQAALLHLL